MSLSPAVGSPLATVTFSAAFSTNCVAVADAKVVASANLLIVDAEFLITVDACELVAPAVINSRLVLVAYVAEL